MNVYPTPIIIGYVLCYEKVDPPKNNKYISVDSYNERFGKLPIIQKPIGQQRYIEVTDTKKNLLLIFTSRKQVCTRLKVCYNAVSNNIKKKGLIKRRYKIKEKFIPKSNAWETV